MAHNVLRLQVQMDHRPGVHVVDAFADLTHEQDAIVFGERKVVGHDALKQFAASNAANCVFCLSLY